MISVVNSPTFDSRALAKFSAMAIVACMLFDCAYALVLPMVTALPLEIAALLICTYFLGWWGKAFRYTMKTASLTLSVVLPNIAMGFLIVLMSLQAVKGWQ